MIRHALSVAGLVGFSLCASCATNQTQVADAQLADAQPAAPAAMNGERQITLTVGDSAPPLAIAHWVKGEPVEAFEEGNVYVVEFWATWCGPCLASMPHISELQQKYADYDVTIVGVSDEPLETVETFLSRTDSEDVTWNEKIQYTLTTDPDRSVFTDYMRAAGQNGIPTAFIVGKDSHIEWIGHPIRMDDPLHDVVHDQWDREAALAEAKRAQEARQKAMAQRAAMAEARAAGNWEKVLAMLDEQIEASGGAPQMMYQKFVTLIADVKSFHAGYAYGERIVDKAWDEPQVLNMVAWFVLDDARVENRNLNFAHRAAVRANELTESKNAAILDTLARAHYEMGELEEAIKWQRLAVEHAGEGQMAEGIREVLEKYEAEAGGVL